MLKRGRCSGQWMVSSAEVGSPDWLLATISATPGVRSRLDGVGQTRGSFPRGVADGEGYSAVLQNVPSFVMIPPLRLGFSYKDAFDALVTVILVAATILWVLGQRRSQRIVPTSPRVEEA